MSVMTMEQLIVIGIIFILLGVALVLIPILGQHVSLEDIPTWLIYVYRRGNFYFATSPILILVSLLLLILRLFPR